VAIDLKISAVPTRESRLGSITGYNGDLQDVINQSKCGSLKNKERCFSQSS
jgi:nitrogenase molybdenum-iron protein alpha chain